MKKAMRSKKQQKIIRIIAVVLIILMIVGSVAPVFAAETSKDVNLNNINGEEQQEIIKDIAKDIVYNKYESFRLKSMYFAGNGCFEKLYKYIQENDIGSDGIINMVIDTVGVGESATGDTVAMVSLKLGYNSDSYNKLYMIEMHIDANGDIYGYNIWAY